MEKCFITAVLACSLMTACVTQADVARQEANVYELASLKDVAASLNAEYKVLEARYLAKEISLDDFTRTSMVLKDNIEKATASISNVKEDIEAQRESGIGWGELIGATLLAVASRGIPSKGPFRVGLNLLTGLLPKEEKRKKRKG